MVRHPSNEIDENGNTLLTEENDYIKNSIELYQLRFDNNFYVNFDVAGVINGQEIASMILIAFVVVENAFEHGQLNDARHPITSKLMCVSNFLLFVVKTINSRIPKTLPVVLVFTISKNVCYLLTQINIRCL